LRCLWRKKVDLPSSNLANPSSDTARTGARPKLEEGETVLKFHETASLCLITGIFCLAGLAPVQRPGSQATANLTSLRGLSRTEVLDRLGVPMSVSAAPGATVFTYSSSSEGLEVVFHDGVAVHVANPSAAPESRGPVPKSRIYPGQPVRELVLIMGASTSHTSGGGVLELQLDSREVVHLAGGIVIGIDAAE